MFTDLTTDQIARAGLGFAATLVSLTFHEAAHAAVAWLKGDRTAHAAGRLTLNPLAHVDPVGTVLLPLIGAFSNLPIIGWAKPVPVDLRNLKNPRWDHLQIAAAGPLSNLLLSVVSLGALVASGPTPVSPILLAMVWVNAFLGVFNLLPFPPLDGGTVAATLLPPTSEALHGARPPLWDMDPLPAPRDPWPRLAAACRGGVCLWDQQAVRLAFWRLTKRDPVTRIKTRPDYSFFAPCRTEILNQSRMFGFSDEKPQSDQVYFRDGGGRVVARQRHRRR